MRCVAIALLLAGLPALVGCEEASQAVGADAGQVQSSAGKAGGQAQPAKREVTLKILDYQQIKDLITSHQGKVVVMDAWSTACAPCIKEFPNLVKLDEKYPDKDLACISLSFDYEGIDAPEDQQERVLTFLKAQNATFDNVLNKDESDELYKKMGLDAVPAVFVFDRQGKLRQKFDSNYRNAADEHFTYEDVNKLVAELVAEEAK